MSVLTGETGPREHVPESGASVAAPFLRIGGYPSDRARGPDTHLARIDLADSHGIALTLDPLEPEPGFPVTAHASMLARLWQAVSGLPPQSADVLTLTLLRAYRAAGWDTVTGTPTPGATLPRLGNLMGPASSAMAELGCDKRTRSLVTGFIRVRLGEMCSGAGMFFGGGHRLNVPALVSRDVELVTGSLDDQTRALAAGTLLLRLTEHARINPAPGGSARHILVVDDGDRLLGDGVSGLIADAAGHGQAVVLSGWYSGPEYVTTDAAPPPAPAADLALVANVRTPSCGSVCRRSGPCTRYDIRAGAVLAAAPASEPLRDWTRALVRAFITGRALPVVPGRLGTGWTETRARLRECALATIVDEEVTLLAPAVRGSYPPARLAGVVARTAAAMLAGQHAPSRAGQFWVPPVARWLHEAARVGWSDPLGEGRGVDADQIAPPLDFAIAGLADWPGMTAGQRLSLLLRHPLSAEHPRNCDLAALLGVPGG